MNIHEYQAKELLRRYNVPVLKGKPVFSADEAWNITKTEFIDNGINVVVLKSQIHAGGRGKGTIQETGSRGVVLAKSIDEVFEKANRPKAKLRKNLKSLRSIIKRKKSRTKDDSTI